MKFRHLEFGQNKLANGQNKKATVEDGKLKVFHLSRIIPYDPSGLTEENPVLEQVKELRGVSSILENLSRRNAIGKTHSKRY